MTFQLVAIDVEGNDAFFLDQFSLSTNGLPVPVVAPASIQYRVDFDTDLVTIVPSAGITGRHRIAVATAVSPDAVDYQVVPVVIGSP